MRRASFALCALAAAACSPTYSPPMRVVNYGAPAALSPQQGAVYGGLGVGGETRGTLGVTIPMAERLRLEAGGDGSAVGATGRVGVRYGVPLRMGAFDAEAGVGAGVGGTRCGNDTDPTHACGGERETDRLIPDGRTPWERFAYGVYGGFGLGIRPWRWIEAYARAGLQVTHATNTPTTLWVTALGAVQVRIGPVDVHAGFGWAGYYNEYDTWNGPLLEFGVMVPFGPRAPR